MHEMLDDIFDMHEDALALARLINHVIEEGEDNDNHLFLCEGPTVEWHVINHCNGVPSMVLVWVFENLLSIILDQGIFINAALNNKLEQSTIFCVVAHNMMNFAIGNGLLNVLADDKGMYDYFWTQALISDEIIDTIHKNYYPPLTTQQYDLCQEAQNTTWGPVQKPENGWWKKLLHGFGDGMGDALDESDDEGIFIVISFAGFGDGDLEERMRDMRSGSGPDPEGSIGTLHRPTVFLLTLDARPTESVPTASFPTESFPGIGTVHRPSPNVVPLVFAARRGHSHRPSSSGDLLSAASLLLCS
ncbi:Serine carboxypeptidase II-3 [Nymphaea thermarum]|nr:Serine carboxypeptidase II-3 [Nymphaea thermarum]